MLLSLRIRDLLSRVVQAASFFAKMPAAAGLLVFPAPKWLRSIKFSCLANQLNYLLCDLLEL